MLMNRILIIEDDAPILQLYSAFLRREGYETLEAQNGLEAWNILEKETIDLIITDIMMPDMDGYEFLRLLRRDNPLMPVLMISAREDFPAKTLGFSLGADDYMTKPVNLEEMLLRIQALLRRANIMSQKKLTLPDLELDYDAMTVAWQGDTFMLPRKEFLLLYKLLSFPNKIFTRMQLMDEIWGRDSSSDAQTVDVHINRLRRRFEGNRSFEILSVRGLGYKAVIRE